MSMRLEVFIPDGDEARRWAEEELSSQRYAQARPTWFDLLMRDLAHFIGDIFTPDGGGRAGPGALIVVIVVIVAALIAALIFWGKPRAIARASAKATDLLGEKDDRSAARLRADADRSARGGDWDSATILRFRAIARGLIERDLIAPSPGATAQAIAREASTVFVDERSALREAAVAFDDVRYLQHGSTEHQYRLLVELDDRLSVRRPESIPA